MTQPPPPWVHPDDPRRYAQPVPYAPPASSVPPQVVYVQAMPEEKPYSGMAVAALVTALLWGFGVGSIIAIILACVAMSDTGRGVRRGYGMALTALLLGIAGAAVTAVFFLSALGALAS